MRALVTGGAGFIGSHICDALVKRGDEVRVLDDFSTGNRENLAAIRERIELVEGDIRDDETVREAVRGADLVYHQAALPSVPRSIADPITSHDVNATGTLKVLEAARLAGVRRVVYASSSSIYGIEAPLPTPETWTPDPRSPYAASKLAGECYCRAFRHVYGLETISLRYFNVFGPRQDPSSQYAAVVPKFISCLLRDGPPTIYGDGEQTRGFTYVQDVVHANLLAGSTPTTHCGAFNVSGEHTMSVNGLFRILAKLTGRKWVVPEYAEERLGDVRHSQADLGKAHKVLGYRPEVDPEEGLRRTVEWFQNVTA